MRSQIAQRMESFSPFYVMELLQRAKQLEQQGRDVIHMEIGEPDLPTPQAIISAGLEAIKSGDIKYTAAAGLIELREKIAAYYLAKYSVSIDPHRVFITPGASGAFLLALGASVNPGEKIQMADPCYPCNNNFVRFFDANTEYINVSAETHYQLTANLIEQHWDEKTAGVLVASPSNPTGTIISKTELQRSIAQVTKLGGNFYSDEIYHGLVYDKEQHSALEFSNDVFVINSFSKYFAMTGWRIGWLIVPDGFIDPVERLAQNIFISTPTHSQFAALQAFTEENISELENRKNEFGQRRNFLYDNLLRLGFKILVKPEGAFYIYADCSQFTDDSFQFAKDLLEQEGVAVTPGKDFGENQANCYIRFAYTASVAKMSVAIKRIESFLCQ